MRLVLATKREVDMSERKLLFLMTTEQAEAYARQIEAAEHGDGGAACRLGDMYREGLRGLRYSAKETYRWYATSALASDPNGQNNLGACYEHGLGCAQSYAKAAKWYRLSAAQKLATASMNLGYCYLRGHGVPADKVEALRLFRLAVQGGEDRAEREVEKLAAEMERPIGKVRHRIRFTNDGGQTMTTESKKPAWDEAHQQQLYEHMTDDDHFGLPDEGTVERQAIRQRAQKTLDILARRGALPPIKLGQKGPIEGPFECGRSAEPRLSASVVQHR